MKLLNAQQIHDWDAYTIEKDAIASIDLMEKAAKACVDNLLKHFSEDEVFYIFCGKGNNGGDGMAIARLLQTAGRKVKLWELFSEKSGTLDFETNKQSAVSIGLYINEIKDLSDFPKATSNIILIDALFGSGLNKPLRGIALALVKYLNQYIAKAKIAIDVPSGMFLDHSSKGNISFQATDTYTFQVLKFCFLLPENAVNFGKVQVLDIGLNLQFLDEIESPFQLVDIALVKKIYHIRSAYANKGTFGHALLIAGNSGKMGAAVMAATASLRSGVGLLTCSVPNTEMLILPIVLPEAMSVLRNDPIVWEKYKAIGIGPGLGTAETELLGSVLKNTKVPLVLDADALNMLAANKEWLKRIPEGSILSPHPKEFARLFGEMDNDADRIYKALEISQQYPFVVILKGHNTLIACDGKGFFNTTGNSGMATGGSGDTLTGILTSLLAQGYSGKDAAILGVYIHGLAGDLALSEESEESLLPTDISKYLGKAFKIIGC